MAQENNISAGFANIEQNADWMMKPRKKKMRFKLPLVAPVLMRSSVLYSLNVMRAPTSSNG